MDREFVIHWVIEKFDLNKHQQIYLEMLDNSELLEFICEEMKDYCYDLMEPCS